MPEINLPIFKYKLAMCQFQTNIEIYIILIEFNFGMWPWTHDPTDETKIGLYVFGDWQMDETHQAKIGLLPLANGFAGFQLCVSVILSATDIWWPTLETCLNLFTWRPTPEQHLATEACTVWILEFFLVN